MPEILFKPSLTSRKPFQNPIICFQSPNRTSRAEKSATISIKEAGLKQDFESRKRTALICPIRRMIYLFFIYLFTNFQIIISYILNFLIQFLICFLIYSFFQFPFSINSFHLLSNIVLPFINLYFRTDTVIISSDQVLYQQSTVDSRLLIVLFLS